MDFKKLTKLKKGDKVAVLSPSFAAPAIFPKIFELGLDRLRSEFGLIPVEYPTTRKLNASTKDRTKDLIAAFEDTDIKAVFASIGGDDQVTYIKDLPIEPFANNPKPFFGYSDNSHFMNFLWIHGIPSYYGGSVMTQLAMQKRMDDFTKKYLSIALFDGGKHDLNASETFNEIGLDWSDDSNLNQERIYEKNNGLIWSSRKDGKGILWGGCLESIDEMLRHNVAIPSLSDFSDIVLITETSEDMPKADYVMRVYRALGERGILANLQGILVGRPKAWEFDNPREKGLRDEYRHNQVDAIEQIVRKYNKDVPVVQNVDFGHTDPQIPMPLGRSCEINVSDKTITVEF